MHPGGGGGPGASLASAPGSVDVLGIGYAAEDRLCQVPRYPASGEKLAISRFLRQGGGQTATALAALGRWGRRVRAVCAVGDDEAGRFVVAELERDGVDTSAMVVRPGVPTLTSHIVVDGRTAERTIIYHRDPRLNLDHPDDVDPDIVRGARCLFIDGHELASLHAARRARELGIPVVLDCERMRPFIGELLDVCDVVICNRAFPAEYTGEPDPPSQLRRMAAHGMAVLAMTLGPGGTLAWIDDRPVHVPAFAVEVLDTTGAGDVFHAGFTHAHLDGHPVVRCLEFASAVAALKCAELGGRTGIPVDPERGWELIRQGDRLPPPPDLGL